MMEIASAPPRGYSCAQTASRLSLLNRGAARRYVIAAFLIDPTKILWREKQAYLDVLTSTFVNRNTAAVFFGSHAIAWIVALAALVRGVRIRRRDIIVPVAAVSVAVLALVHSLIDFSLQIPDHAIVVFALLGAGSLSHTPVKQE